MTTSPVLVRRAIRPEDLPPEFIHRPAAYLSSLFQSGGPGTVVLLAQASVWELEAIIKIAVDDAELATEGVLSPSFVFWARPHYKSSQTNPDLSLIRLSP